MSDVELDDYRVRMRAWLEDNLPRREPGAPLRSAHDVSPEQLAADRARQQQVYEAGYLGITLPTEYGGQGLTARHQHIWNEEAAGYAVPAPGGIASASPSASCCRRSSPTPASGRSASGSRGCSAARRSGCSSSPSPTPGPTWPGS